MNYLNYQKEKYIYAIDNSVNNLSGIVRLIKMPENSYS